MAWTGRVGKGDKHSRTEGILYSPPTYRGSPIITLIIIIIIGVLAYAIFPSLYVPNNANLGKISSIASTIPTSSTSVTIKTTSVSSITTSTAPTTSISTTTINITTNTTVMVPNYTVHPGPNPLLSACPAMISGAAYTNGTIKKLHGNIINYTLFSNTSTPIQDIIMSPGATGTVVYNITRSVFGSGSTNTTAANSIYNITNNVIFFHESEKTVNVIVTAYGETLAKYRNGTLIDMALSKNITEFVNFTLNIGPGTVIEYPNGTMVNLSVATNLTYYGLQFGNTIVYDFYTSCVNGGCVTTRSPTPVNSSTVIRTFPNSTVSGVTLQWSPLNESLAPGQNSYANLTISVATNVVRGTYWLVGNFSGEACVYDPYSLFTVGNSAYNGTYASISSRYIVLP